MKAGASLNPMYLYKVSRKGVIIIKTIWDSPTFFRQYTLQLYVRRPARSELDRSMCVWTAIRSATKRLLVRILRTQQFVTYWCGFLRRTIDKILFKYKIRIWLKSAVWYATALNQLEGIKSRPSTGIILAFIEAQIWSTGYCTYSWIKKLCQ